MHSEKADKKSMQLKQNKNKTHLKTSNPSWARLLTEDAGEACGVQISVKIYFHVNKFVHLYNEDQVLNEKLLKMQAEVRDVQSRAARTACWGIQALSPLSIIQFSLK